MGKRRVVVVLSSSDEDEDRCTPSSRDRASAGPRSRSASASRKRPRGGRSSKPDRSSVARSRNPSRGAEVVKFDTLSEEFSECLHDFGRLSGLKCSKMRGLWVDEHKPHSLADLAVHKKKVEEVNNWLEERLKMPKDEFGNGVLLITGQAGSGKSATIHVIASQLGAELCEWTTPTPTLWQEYVHNTNSGMRYVSKLDEFENFVEKIRKYGLLRPAHRGASLKPLILLIDDLPVTNGRVAFGRLNRCLTTLAISTKVPTVILITEYHKTESGNSATHHSEDLVVALQRAGAYKVAFNPITVNSIKKVLSRICQEEKCEVSSEWIYHIAKASGGDIRHAITSLQYCCLRPSTSFPRTLPTQPVTYSDIDPSKASTFLLSSPEYSFECSIPFSFGRDETLSLFHALGKFLHNKREIPDPSEICPKTLILHERFERNPLKMDDPEKVLSQAHGQARPIIDFLHENVLDFMHDDAVDDAWLVASYISDADCLLASPLSTTWHRMIGGVQQEIASQAIAASVAVRGVLFGNSQPSSSRWHSIRSPRLWQVEHSARFNKNQMLKERDEVRNRHTSCNMFNVVTEYRPRSELLSQIPDAKAQENSVQYSEEMDSDWTGLDNLETENFCDENEDEIEDW